MKTFPAVAIGALALVAASACDTIRGVTVPEETRIEISSDDLSSVTLVTSFNFVQAPDPECEGQLGCPTRVVLLSADTMEVALPFDQVYNFNSRLQIFVESYPTEPESATLRMRARVDGETWYDDFRTLQPFTSEGVRETLQFVYEFNQATLP